MFSTSKSNIVCDASGNDTVYLAPGSSINPNGFLVELKYTPGTIDTAAVLTVTTESGRPIMTKSSAGTSTAWYLPRALLNAVADGAESTNASEFIPIKNERIKVVVSGGGNGGAGSIEATLLNNPPY